MAIFEYSYDKFKETVLHWKYQLFQELRSVTVDNSLENDNQRWLWISVGLQEFNMSTM